MPGQTGKKTIFQGRATQLLIKLKKDGRHQTGDLVKYLGISRPPVCEYLRILERAGFVKTIPDTRPGHRTKRYKEITSAGLRFLDDKYAETGARDDYYKHEEVKLDGNEVKYSEYRKMKEKQDQAEVDDLLSEEI